jgi:hypothetical protein
MLAVHQGQKNILYSADTSWCMDQSQTLQLGGLACSHVSVSFIRGRIPVRLRLKCDGTRAETIFRLSAKRTSPFKSAGASVQSTTGSRSVGISGSNVGYIMFRGSVKSTGYPLHSPVSPSLPHPCVTCAITLQLDSTTLVDRGAGPVNGDRRYCVGVRLKHKKAHLPACLARKLPRYRRYRRYFDGSFSTFKINLLKTKHNLLYVRNQSVPRCKRFQRRL